MGIFDKLKGKVTGIIGSILKKPAVKQIATKGFKFLGSLAKKNPQFKGLIAKISTKVPAIASRAGSMLSGPAAAAMVVGPVVQAPIRKVAAKVGIPTNIPKAIAQKGFTKVTQIFKKPTVPPAVVRSPAANVIPPAFKKAAKVAGGAAVVGAAAFAVEQIAEAVGVRGGAGFIGADPTKKKKKKRSKTKKRKTTKRKTKKRSKSSRKRVSFVTKDGRRVSFTPKSKKRKKGTRKRTISYRAKTRKGQIRPKGVSRTEAKELRRLIKKFERD